MGMRIDNNNAAVNLQTQVQPAVTRTAQTPQTTSAKTDYQPRSTNAARLSVSDSAGAQVRQFTHETGVYQEGVAVAQAAQSGLETQRVQLSALQDIATQAQDPGITADQRAQLAREAQDALNAIDDTANKTTFNGSTLLDGGKGSLALDGPSGPSVALADTTAKSLGLEGLDLSSAQGATAAADQIASAQTRVEQARTGFQTQAGRLTEALERRLGTSENATNSRTQIEDTETARRAIDQLTTKLNAESSPSSLLQTDSSTRFVADLLGA